MNTKKWYIFDCYGTLVEPIHNTWANLLLSLIQNKKYLKDVLLTQNIPIRQVLENYTTIDSKNKLKIIEWFTQDTTRIYDDAKKLLDKCYHNNIPFVILTNISYDYMMDIENIIGTVYKNKRDELFTILYSCEIGYKKPEPEAYHTAINFLLQQWITKDNITMIWDNKLYDDIEPRKYWINTKHINRTENIPWDENQIQSFEELDI